MNLVGAVSEVFGAPASNDADGCLWRFWSGLAIRVPRKPTHIWCSHAFSEPLPTFARLNKSLGTTTFYVSTVSELVESLRLLAGLNGRTLSERDIRGIRSKAGPAAEQEWQREHERQRLKTELKAQLDALQQAVQHASEVLMPLGVERFTDEERTQMREALREIDRDLGMLLSNREPIPSDVKKAVWERDGGRCAKCGSTYRLHYDHVIPASKGGGISVTNVQLLCEKCNLSKGDRIE